MTASVMSLEAHDDDSATAWCPWSLTWTSTGSQYHLTVGIWSRWKPCPRAFAATSVNIPKPVSGVLKYSKVLLTRSTMVESGLQYRVVSKPFSVLTVKHTTECPPAYLLAVHLAHPMFQVNTSTVSYPLSLYAIVWICHTLTKWSQKRITAELPLRKGNAKGYAIKTSFARVMVCTEQRRVTTVQGPIMQWSPVFF